MLLLEGIADSRGALGHRPGGGGRAGQSQRAAGDGRAIATVPIRPSRAPVRPRSAVHITPTQGCAFGFSRYIRNDS